MSTHKAYIFFWGAIPFLLVASLVSPNSAFDIQLQDTYFVIPISQFFFLVAFLFLLLGLGYWWVKNKPLNKWLTLIHVVITILALPITWLLLKEGMHMQGLGYHTNPPSAKVELIQQNYQRLIFMLILFGGVQLLFITNLILGCRK